MKKQGKYLLMLSLFVCLFFLSCKQTDKLYVAVSPDYAPYEFVNLNESGQDQYVGADIDFAHYLAQQMEKELVIEAMGFTEALASVQNGRVDLAISGFTYSSDRAKNYEMSQSYYDDGDGDQVVIVLKENQDKYSTFEALNKKEVRIGVQDGSVQADYANEQLPDATKEKIATINDGILWLKEKKIDAMAIASNAAEVVMTTNPEIVICDEKFDVTGKTGLFALAKKGDKELIAEVNAIIDEVKEQGLYETWLTQAQELYVQLGEAAVEGIVDDAPFIVRIWKMFVNHFGDFMKGLGITLALSLLGVLFAAIFGTLLCLMNISKVRLLRWISTAYIEIIRGIPLLLQLTVIFLLMPKGMSKFITCVIALVINSSAYQAEIFRSGIQSVDQGQMEAARSLGLSYPKAMFKVILPQAIKNTLPSLANEFVSLIKETSLSSTFYVGDLMTVKSIITSTTYDSLTPYVIIAIIYFIITFSLSKLIRWWEKKGATA